MFSYTDTSTEDAERTKRIYQYTCVRYRFRDYEDCRIATDLDTYILNEMEG